MEGCRVTAPIFVVDKVTETWCIHDSQAETNTILFNVWKDWNHLMRLIAKWYVEKRSRPALMLSMATVWGRSALGGRGSLGGYRVVLKRVLMSVDLPKPDSPASRVKLAH